MSPWFDRVTMVVILINCITLDTWNRLDFFIVMAG
ncbi:unnamed protein product [Cylicostephanus goldi]|uniref:Ion transport domain-containing protein n=1 Tax=Cylicostephanus goldi TaxID=71465 RepID=A0A3P6SBA4_CYLGO|nr:unnamed protein product [Cylicostephanus goldi]